MTTIIGPDFNQQFVSKIKHSVTNLDLVLRTYDSRQ